MSLTITHTKTNTIPDWDQQKLDAAISAGLYPQGTRLADIVLPSDWNHNHDFSGFDVEMASVIHAATAKTTLVDADEIAGTDSASSFSLIRTTMANVWTYIKSKADAVYLGISATAAKATILETARKINGILFDGSGDISGMQSGTYATMIAVSSPQAGWTFWCTDVGKNGSSWTYNGTEWALQGQITLLSTYLTFLRAPSGTIDVTTGVLTLGTAISNTYLMGQSNKFYMYFPAGAWTGSAAGWYYVTMSSTTSGLVYSNTYTTGNPTVPSSPSLVTTGAGAYTGVTTSVLGPNVSIPSDILNNRNGSRLKLSLPISHSNNSAGAKTVSPYINSIRTAVYNATTSTTGASTNEIIIPNPSNTTVVGNGGSGSGHAFGYVSQTSHALTGVVFGVSLTASVATDWVSTFGTELSLSP